jgi:hypothetical protein
MYLRAEVRNALRICCNALIGLGICKKYHNIPLRKNFWWPCEYASKVNLDVTTCQFAMGVQFLFVALFTKYSIQVLIP